MTPREPLQGDPWVEVIRMGELTSAPDAALAAAQDHPVVLMRHGFPVATLRVSPELPEAAREVSFTTFQRSARSVIEAVRISDEPRVLTERGSPALVIEPVDTGGFEQFVMAHSPQIRQRVEAAEQRAFEGLQEITRSDRADGFGY